jgi:hypothetical protein
MTTYHVDNLRLRPIAGREGQLALIESENVGQGRVVDRNHKLPRGRVGKPHPELLRA